jgi:O-antigen/teichoic acid export membrane protein
MVLLLIGIIVLDVLSAMPLARLRYSEQAARFAAINLINVLLTLGLNLIFLLAMRLGIEYALVANFIASAIRLAMVVQDNLPDHIIPQNKFFAPMLGYGFYIMLAGLAGAVNEMLSRNMLPRLWPDGALYHSVPRTGLELNGIFSAAYKLGMFITLFTQAFRYAVEPIFFKQSGQKDSPRIFATITHYYGLAGLTGFVLIASFSYEIVSFNFWGLIRRTLIPKEYWIGLEAVPLILLANIAFGLYLNMAFWFKLTGQLRFGLLFALAGAIITVMLNFLTIPYFAYMGCAVTSVICYTAMCWLCYNTGQKYYPIPYRWRRLIVYSVIFGIIYLINSRLSYPYIYDQWPITFLKMILCALGIIFVYLIESRKPFITLFHEEIFNIDASNNTKNTIKGNIRRK